MAGSTSALVGALLLGAASTFGDWAWARYRVRHTAIAGLLHGGLLLLGLGLHLGLRRGRPLRGALGGGAVGLAAAASFYALAPWLGYSAMFPAWMGLWLGFALLDARALRAAVPLREALARGALAALGSGTAFYAISGIWTRPRPGGPDYAYNFLCWTLAFLPGFLALLLERRPGGAGAA